LRLQCYAKVLVLLSYAYSLHRKQLLVA